MSRKQSDRNLDTPRTISLQSRLNRLGRSLGIPANVPQVMRLFYIQDAFLARLALSPYQQHFVLGGALLLLKTVQNLSESRPTQDADFTCIGLAPDEMLIGTILQDIVQIPHTDEVIFDASVLAIETIQQQGALKGLRARIPARLGNAREMLSLDLVFGTALVSGPQVRQVSMTLDPLVTVSLLTYPLQVVMSGKVASILLHAVNNTRYKDYFDLHVLARKQDFDGSTLETALQATCQAQGVALDPSNAVMTSPTFLTDANQLKQWERFVTHSGLEARAPSFAEAIMAVRALYGPVLAGAAAGHRWDHMLQQWV